MKLFYADNFELPLPSRHRFPMSKYRLLRERIEASDFVEGLTMANPPGATDEQLLLVHESTYLGRLKRGELSELEIRRIGFPWSPEMVERSRRSTGASIAAANAAIAYGVSGNLAGGTHHAFADHGQGYCVFNDVCVAVRCLQEKGQIQTALIIDLDVHQGNGTAAIVSGDSSIFSFSMHCEKNYPFKKTDGDLDIALPENCGDAVYLQRLRDALDEIGRHFDPDILCFLAGADPYSGDRMGRLSLSKTGLADRDKLVFQFGEERNLPIAFCMAGGYAPNVQDIVDIHFATVCAAYQSFCVRNGVLPIKN